MVGLILLSCTAGQMDDSGSSPAVEPWLGEQIQVVPGEGLPAQVLMACCEAFAAGGPIAIHVLGDEQEALSNRFARGGADKWADLAYGAGEHGAPLIDGTLATFECRPYAQYPGGDHTIFVAEVRQLRFRDGDPLVFCAGGYRQLAERELCA